MPSVSYYAETITTFTKTEGIFAWTSLFSTGRLLTPTPTNIEVLFVQMISFFWGMSWAPSSNARGNVCGNDVVIP